MYAQSAGEENLLGEPHPGVRSRGLCAGEQKFEVADEERNFANSSRLIEIPDGALVSVSSQSPPFF